MTTTQRWEENIRQACEHFIEDLKQTLPANASFADIERTILKYSPEMLRQAAEALANAEDFSPSPERDT